jgi:hypothetical protein
MHRAAYINSLTDLCSSFSVTPNCEHCGDLSNVCYMAIVLFYKLSKRLIYYKIYNIVTGNTEVVLRYKV